MSAQIINIRANLRPVVRQQCDAITGAEGATVLWVRWSAAVWRDWLRAWWGV